MLIFVPLAAMIEFERLRLSANTVNVLVVLPKALPFAVGSKLPSIDVLLKVRFPETVRSPLTPRVWRTCICCVTSTFAVNVESPFTNNPLSTLKLVFAMSTLLN
jgi:hypothetical protein